MRRPKIAIFPEAEFSGRRRLWQALSAFLPLEFVAWDEPAAGTFEAVILAGVPQDKLQTVPAGLPCFLSVSGERIGTPPGALIDFSSRARLHPAFRGRSLPDPSVKEWARLTPLAGDEVVASCGGQPLWLRRPAAGSTLDLSAFELPRLGDAEYLFQHFHAENWMPFLPLLAWLRELSGVEYPPARACFVFDDPNLHWKTYGCINYRELAEDAHKHNYHACFATVPVDSWYVHPGTAALFREQASRLSLVFHGNTHLAYELIRVEGEENRRMLAVQAWRRIERLERLSGLQVPRIMTAPHGACNHEMAAELLRAGFEAACISRSSIMNRNRETAWPLTVGLNLAEFLGPGLPTFPRFLIWTHKHSRLNALLAAFLGQAMIPLGHHEDLDSGLDLLRELAAIINSTGPVQWSGMTRIARGNFCSWRDGGVWHVKTFSRRFDLAIPEGVTQCCIQRPWLAGNGGEPLVLEPAGVAGVEGDRAKREFPAYQGEPIRVAPGETWHVRLPYPDLIDRDAVRVAPSSLWALTRRQLCEVRDRLRPLRNRLRGGVPARTDTGGYLPRLEG